MSQTEKNQTCAICLEIPKPTELAKLDNCKHLYCFLCIKNWVDSSESKCPQCKFEIGKITYKDVEGKEIQLLVESKHQGMDCCIKCRREFRPVEFVSDSGVV